MREGSLWGRVQVQILWKCSNPKGYLDSILQGSVQWYRKLIRMLFSMLRDSDDTSRIMGREKVVVESEGCRVKEILPICP